MELSEILEDLHRISALGAEALKAVSAVDEYQKELLLEVQSYEL